VFRYFEYLAGKSCCGLSNFSRYTRQLLASHQCFATPSLFTRFSRKPVLPRRFTDGAKFNFCK